MVHAKVALQTLLELTRDLRGERPLEEALEEVTRAAVRLLCREPRFASAAG